MTRVAVLLGGRSAERDISLLTGAAVSGALTRLGYDVIELDADRNLAQKLIECGADSAFIALHGRWGEDGTVQGLLEMLGIPYTGSGVAASALAMNKNISKILFKASGISTPDFQLLGPTETAVDLEIVPPFVAKPVSEGSTIGVAVAKTMDEATAAIAQARAATGKTLIEKFIEGKEVTLSVLNGDPLPLVEIVPGSGFYDFEAKYTPGKTNYICPSTLAEKSAKTVQEVGVKAYEALGCQGAARVDIIVDSSDIPWILEVNTIPGMTPTSLLPKAAAAAGITFDELVERMMESAELKA